MPFTWEGVGLTIGEHILDDPEWKAKVLRLYWMWRDVGAESLKEMRCTDLVSVVPWFRGKPVPYACKVNKRLTPEAERFFMETVREGLSAQKYVHIYSEWNAPTVIAYKPAVSAMTPEELREALEKTPAKVFRLTHNYRFLNRQVSHPENRLELSSRVVDVLSDPRNKEFASFDLRNAFWAFPVPPQYRKYFAFTAPDGCQYAPAIMPQGYAPAPFICAAGVAIAFGPIPPPNPEPPLLGERFRMYQDDGAIACPTKEEMYEFLRDHLFPSRISTSFLG